MAKRRLTPLDSLFYYGESATTMMHVAGLLPFSSPGDGRTVLRELEQEVRETGYVEPPWNMRLAHPRLKLSPTHSWVTDKHFDIDYHVRRSALPAPGSERELGTLVSRLHSNELDFSRPPWEMHLIEGLEDDRFAVYFKLHHSLVDGYTAMQKLIDGLSTDPDEQDQALIIGVPERERTPRPKDPGGSLLRSVLGVPATAVGGLGSVTRLATRLAEVNLRRSGSYADLVGNVQAPRSILNSRIGRSRRFATQQFELPVLKEIGRRYDATVNDVVLSLVGGGLRRFLGEMGELPEAPLIAFIPVNVRPKDSVGGGNAVGAVLASVGSDVEDPIERLERVAASTRAAKHQLEGMSQEEMILYSAALLAPMLLRIGSAATGVPNLLPPAFNLCVSNVPGPEQPLYLRGARLEAPYPVSIPVHGMALNITVQSYADTLNFGFVGCRDTLPHLQRLAVYTGEARDELEKAAH